MIEQIQSGGLTLALIVRSGFNAPGVHFVTPNEYSQQLGYMQHPPKKVIPPHYHVLHERAVMQTQEVLFIRRGSLRVDFYDLECRYTESRVLSAGDVILLAAGGHGFEVLEELEMIEVKQGPYISEEDKVRFEPVAADRVVLK